MPAKQGVSQGVRIAGEVRGISRRSGPIGEFTQSVGAY